MASGHAALSDPLPSPGGGRVSKASQPTDATMGCHVVHGHSRDAGPVALRQRQPRLQRGVPARSASVPRCVRPAAGVANGGRRAGGADPERARGAPYRGPVLPPGTRDAPSTQVRTRMVTEQSALTAGERIANSTTALASVIRGTTI